MISLFPVGEMLEVLLSAFTNYLGRLVFELVIGIQPGFPIQLDTFKKSEVKESETLAIFPFFIWGC